MSKKFMYVCLGILALVVAFHVGARYGHAGYVDHSTGGIIATMAISRSYTKVILDNGEIWQYTSDTDSWELSSDTQYLNACPVPVSQIKFIDQHDAQSFISTSNELWYHAGGLNWVNAGSPPGGVATLPTTWGRIKAEFGE